MSAINSYHSMLATFGLVALGLTFLSYVILGGIFIDNFCNATDANKSTINPVGIIINGIIGIILAITLTMIIKARNYNQNKLYYIFMTCYCTIVLMVTAVMFVKRKNCAITDEFFIVRRYYYITIITIAIIFIMLAGKVFLFCKGVTVVIEPTPV